MKVILASSQSGTVLGAVTGESPKRDAVVTESGASESWTRDRVFYRSGIDIKATDPVEVSKALRAIRETTADQATQADIEGMWELLVDSAKPTPIVELADILFGSTSSESQLATVIALEDDRLYFKRAPLGTYAPYSRIAVESALHQRNAQDREDGRVEAAVSALTECLKDGTGRSGPAYDDGVTWLKALAIDGDKGTKDSQRGGALIEGLSDGRTSDIEIRALELLVKLNVFDQDEILAVHRHRFPTSFSTEVESSARDLAEQPISATEMAGRRTFDLPGVIAIDDPWTTDVDDALCVDLLGSSTRVHVLIADPVAVVPFDSKVAREGMSRTSSLYLPTGKVPMFPRILSEGAASLTTGQTRPALDFAITLGNGGVVLDFQIQPVSVTLDRRMTYDEVDAVLAEPDSNDPARAVLGQLSSFAEALERRRREAGALPVERDEFSVRVENGEVVVRRQSYRSKARRLVAEWMILACSQAGDFARMRNIPVVYRKQDAPRDHHTNDGQGDGPQFDGLRPGSRAYAWQLLLTLNKAELTMEPGFHWGLGVVGYTQVTSPLRRFQDFIAHYQIKNYLRDGVAPLDSSIVLGMFGDLEERAGALAKTEREAKRYFLMKYLSRFTGQVVTGEVVGSNGSRAMVELDDTGLVLPVAHGGRLPLGKIIDIKVFEVDPRRDRADLRIA